MTSPFNPVTDSVNELVRRLSGVGYLPFDLNAIGTLHFVLRQGVSAQDGSPVPALLMDGPPGVGKTYLAQCLAKVWDAEYLEYNCHPDSTVEELVKDINLAPIVNAMAGLVTSQLDKRDLVVIGHVLYAVELSKTKRVVLTIDELDKSRPAVDALLLGFLNNGYLNVAGEGNDNGVTRIQANLQNLVVVITKNDERDLHPALLRRCRVVYTAYPPKAVERRMLERFANIGQEASGFLVTMANTLRASDDINKKPSPPEVLRLAREFADVAAQMVATPLTNGKLVCPFSRDLLKNLLINGLLANQVDHGVGKRILLAANKDPGSALLYAILRGMNRSEQIYFQPESDLRAGK